MTRAVVARAAAIVCLALVVSTTVAVRADAASQLSVPSSIDARGRVDVSRALEQFLETVPAGATVVFPAGARYRVESVLQIQRAQNVTIDGNGAEIFAETTGADFESPGGRFRARWPRLREHVSVQDATGLTIRNLTIRGPNDDGRFVPSLEGQAGIAIYRSTDVVIDDVRVVSIHGDGIYVAGKSSGLKVTRSSFQTIGRQGIAVVNASDIVVERSRYDDVARSVFDLEPAVPRWGVDQVRLRDNDVGEYTNFLLAAGGAGPNITDVWLENNRVTGGNGIAVFAGMPRWLRRGLYIVGNTSDVPGRNVAGEQRDGVMQIARIEGVEIRGNRMDVSDGPAITLAGVCDAEVGDNDFPGASEDVVATGTCDRTPTPVVGSGRSSRTTVAGREPPAKNAPAENAPSGAAGTRGRGPREVKDTVSGADWVLVVGLAAVAGAGVLWLRRTRRRSIPPE